MDEPGQRSTPTILRSSGSRREMEESVRALRQNLEAHFETPTLHQRFRVENVIGHGSFGVTLKVNEYGTTPRRVGRRLQSFVRRMNTRTAVGPQERPLKRRLCVKMPFGGSEDDVRTEIQVLRAVNGSVHVPSLIAYRDDDARLAGILASREFPRRAPSQGDFLAGLAGPIIVLEYLENGPLSRLIQRLQTQDVIPGAPAPAAASNLVHGDIHSNNLLLGDINPAIGEHSRVPIMKLIDFGQARDNPGNASQANLFGITAMILRLIIRNEEPSFLGNPQHVNGIWQDDVETVASELCVAPGLGGPVDPYGHVDNDLRDMICRCMARDPAQNPTLEQAYERAQQAVTRKKASSFLMYGTLETNDDLETFMQRLIFNAE
ncbi:hypothetical protein F5Y16DRAFT_422772 [Xylariaceae sp. FL0255]|nr:hypothetical protein F5Y16DRAFT_422772 [Xylariaceae sp. FL0255]